MPHKIKKERIVFLLMGLVLGFTLGISILFWRQSLSSAQDFFVKSARYLKGIFESKEYEAPSEEVVIKPKSKKKKEKKTNEADSVSMYNEIDTTLLSSYDSISPDDTLWYDEYSDVYVLLNKKNDEENIARDRLLVRKQIEAKVLSKQNQPSDTQNLDSLLIGGKAPKEEKQIYTVEFWESPLNYRGYKKIKNQLILFGIKQYEQAQLKVLKNELYLSNADAFYLLENTNDFSNLIPVTNQQLINQLKEK